MSNPKEFAAQGGRVGWPMFIGYGALFLMLGTIGYWSVAAQISGAVVATGTVRVESNRQVIQHPDGGVVGEILVGDGDIVEKGAVLVRLDDTFLKSELKAIRRQLVESSARRTRLAAERDQIPTPDFADVAVPESVDPAWAASQITGQKNLFDARQTSLLQEQDQLREQINQTNKQIEGIEAQLTSFSTQVELVSEQLVDFIALQKKGLVQTERVLDLQREKARLEGDIGNLVSSAASARGRIAAIEIEILKLVERRREDAIATLRDLRFGEIDLEREEARLLEALSRLEITAPTEGRVFGNRVFAVQSVVVPADPLMFIVPADQPLEIVARIETVHIDEVFPGQDVALRFSTFDQKVVPEIDGRVLRVSADAVRDETTGISFYEAIVVPDFDTMEKFPEVEILPGMPVETFLRTGERTPLDYLTKPLVSYFNRAFRES